jgi:hypothetical protein
MLGSMTLAATRFIFRKFNSNFQSGPSVSPKLRKPRIDASRTLNRNFASRNRTIPDWDFNPWIFGWIVFVSGIKI